MRFSNLNLSNRIRNSRRGVVQKFAVLGEKLDHNRLGLARQISNHVLQQLDKFDIRGRLGVLDFGPDILDDIVNAAPAVLLQLHGEIAVVGFRDSRRT